MFNSTAGDGLVPKVVKAMTSANGASNELSRFEQYLSVCERRGRRAKSNIYAPRLNTSYLLTRNCKMKAKYLSRCSATVLAAALGITIAACGGGNANAETPVFTLSSPDLTSGAFSNQFILNGLGCSGGNVSPELRWSNVPAGTKSLALQVYDPDAPTGSGLWHWAVYDIAPTSTGLPQGAGNNSSKLPVGAYGGSNDFQDTGVNGGNGKYGGPCPPQGDAPHHYVFTLYALAVDKVSAAASIPPTGTPALFGFVLRKGMGPALLGTASFTATYAKP